MLPQRRVASSPNLRFVGRGELLAGVMLQLGREALFMGTLSLACDTGVAKCGLRKQFRCCRMAPSTQL